LPIQSQKLVSHVRCIHTPITSDQLEIVPGDYIPGEPRAAVESIHAYRTKSKSNQHQIPVYLYPNNR